MRIREFYSNWFAKLLQVRAITLYPCIFYAETAVDAYAAGTKAHEWLHIAQVQKLGWLRFYASYLWQYAKARLRMTARDAYFAVTYEQEAFAHQDEWLKKRDLT